MRRFIPIIITLLVAGFTMTHATAQYGPDPLPPCTGQVSDAWDNCTPPSTTVPFDDGDVDCQEDMPCWNCETMGNHVCGPPTYPVPPAGPVVGSPRFTG